jgi:hypothetical protein
MFGSASKSFANVFRAAKPATTVFSFATGDFQFLLPHSLQASSVPTSGLSEECLAPQMAHWFMTIAVLLLDQSAEILRADRARQGTVPDGDIGNSRFCYLYVIVRADIDEGHAIGSEDEHDSIFA